MTTTKLNSVFIIAAARTGVGQVDGQFSDISSIELGAAVIHRCLFQTKLARSDVSEVIMGQVLCAGLGQNPARQAAHKAGIDIKVTGQTVNQLMGSSLRAIILGYRSLQYGPPRTIICGGQESSSMSHHSGPIRNFLPRISLLDNILYDVFNDPTCQISTARYIDDIAYIHSITRVVQDQLALKSHIEAARMAKHPSQDEMVAIGKPNSQEVISKNEHIKEDISLEYLSSLDTIFDLTVQTNPSVTTGNMAQPGDGAAAIMLCNDAKLRSTKLVPLAQIVGYAEVGIEMSQLAYAPALAIDKLLRKIQWNSADIDLFEISENFAIETLLAIHKFNLDLSKVNIGGGTIGLGNTIGALGAQMMVSLIKCLKHKGVSKGIISVGCGDGTGIAIAIHAFKPVQVRRDVASTSR